MTDMVPRDWSYNGPKSHFPRGCPYESPHLLLPNKQPGGSGFFCFDK